MIDLMLGVLIGLIIGSAVTAMFFKFKGGDASTLKNLKAEHEQYRKQVDNHFVNTSILFKGLTDQYRDVYRHIAEGAGELCSEEAKAIQVEMDEPALLGQQANEGAPVVPDYAVKTHNEDATKKDNGQSGSDDDIPLASEVEMTPEIADEIKSHSSAK